MTSEARRSDSEKWSFARWMGVKRNFLIYATTGGGVLPGALIAWWLRSTAFVPVAFMLFVVAVSTGAGYVVGLIMWRFFEFKRQQWKRWPRKSNDDV